MKSQAGRAIYAAPRPPEKLKLKGSPAVTPPSRPRLAMLLALSSVTMSACGHAGSAKPDLTGPAPDPVVETRVQTRFVCPAALGRDLPPVWVLKPGAVIRHNDEGGQYLDGRIARGQAAEQIVTDARAECAEKQAP